MFSLTFSNRTETNDGHLSIGRLMAVELSLAVGDSKLTAAAWQSVVGWYSFPLWETSDNWTSHHTAVVEQAQR